MSDFIMIIAESFDQSINLLELDHVDYKPVSFSRAMHYNLFTAIIYPLMITLSQ